MSKQYSAPPEIAIDTAKKYQAVMTTNKGAITFDLFASETPNTVNSFVFLSREGFYDGVIFHRIISGFMLQGGDPTGTPPELVDDEAVGCGTAVAVVVVAVTDELERGSSLPHAANARIARDTRAINPPLITMYS